MNARTLALPPQLADLRRRGVAWWAALSARDRRMLGAGAVLSGLLLVWMVGVQPALRTLRDTPAQIDRADLELQRMQALAAESKTLRAAAPVAQGQSAAALRAAAGRLGDKASVLQQGDRMTIKLVGVDGAALRSLLAEARASARARPVEARLVHGPRGYDGTLVLMLGGAG